MKSPIFGRVLLMLCALSVARPGQAQGALDGEWVGGTNALGGWRFTQARFSTTPRGIVGSLDVPTGNAMRLPLAHVVVSATDVRFDIESPLGTFRFAGAITTGVLAGQLTSPAGATSGLHLVRSVRQDAAKYAAAVGTYALSSGQRLVVTYRSFGQLYALVEEGPGDRPTIRRTLNLIPRDSNSFFSSGSINAAPKADELFRFTATASQPTRVEWDAPGRARLVGARMPDDVRQEAAVIHNGAVTLHATFFAPKGLGPHPAVVSVGGSGPTTRDNVVVRARELARTGLAVLVYDKRGTGDSSGGSWSTATFADLASDATSAMRYLRSRPDVDTSRVGWHGHSQGGWVVPLATARAPGARFIILTSSTPFTPADQETFRAGAQARAARLSDAEAEAATQMMRLKWRVAADSSVWPELAAALDRVGTAAWLPIVNVPPTQSSPLWADHRAQLGTPLETQRFVQLRTPILFLYGSEDDEIPAQRSAAAWRQLFGENSASNIEITEIPGVGHGVFFGASAQGAVVKPEVGNVVQRWLRAHDIVR